jgi:hypothetical protein
MMARSRLREEVYSMLRRLCVLAVGFISKAAQKVAEFFRVQDEKLEGTKAEVKEKIEKAKEAAKAVDEKTGINNTVAKGMGLAALVGIAYVVPFVGDLVLFGLIWVIADSAIRVATIFTTVAKSQGVLETEPVVGEAPTPDVVV